MQGEPSVDGSLICFIVKCIDYECAPVYRKWSPGREWTVLWMHILETSRLPVISRFIVLWGWRTITFLATETITVAESENWENIVQEREKEI